MKNLEFPIIPTKIKNLKQKFDLNDPKKRSKYFAAKAGQEIDSLKNFLDKKTFIAFLVGKKNSGKGTYSHLFAEIFGQDKVKLISIGDVVREVHANWRSFSQSEKFNQLKQVYRGYISFDEACNALLGRGTKTLLPTEFILALLKVYILEYEGKTLLIDGLPRESDQVSYSLYFRDLINYRNDQDVFILIDIPEVVLDERLKYRVVCPKCQTPRNTKLLITSKLGYDEKKKEIFLKCDNPKCQNERMVKKEGDSLGIDPIRPRLKKDEVILRTTFSLHGVGKILLRNHVPVAKAREFFDDYEITPEYILSWDKEKKKVRVKEKLWRFLDDNGVLSYSLLPAPVVVSMLKQLVEVLGI